MNILSRNMIFVAEFRITALPPQWFSDKTPLLIEKIIIRIISNERIFSRTSVRFYTGFEKLLVFVLLFVFLRVVQSQSQK